MKVVQQQWFSGNQSTTSVSNMLSPFVSRLSLSNEIWLEKYGYFLLLVFVFQNMSGALFDVGVVQCIIKYGGIHQSSDFFEWFHFIFFFPLAERSTNNKRHRWTNYKHIPISLCFVPKQSIFLFLGTEVIEEQQHLSFLWKSLMNPCGAKSALNWYFTRKLRKVAHFCFCIE